MTREQFHEWLKYHTAMFRSIGEWLRSLPSDPPEGIASQAETLDAWFRVLRRCDLEHAKAASDRLYEETEAEPRSRDKVPAAVARIATKLRLAREQEQRQATIRIHGTPAYRCLLCLDEGLVSVWSPESMRAAREGRLGRPFTLSTVAVACSCEAGTKHDKYVDRFHPNRYLPAPIPTVLSDAEAQDELLAFIATNPHPLFS